MSGRFRCGLLAQFRRVRFRDLFHRARFTHGLRGFRFRGNLLLPLGIRFRRRANFRRWRLGVRSTRLAFRRLSIAWGRRRRLFLFGGRRGFLGFWFRRHIVFLQSFVRTHLKPVLNFFSLRHQFLRGVALRRVSNPREKRHSFPIFLAGKTSWLAHIPNGSALPRVVGRILVRFSIDSISRHALASGF